MFATLGMLMYLFHSSESVRNLDLNREDKDLALVDVIDADGFQDLGLDEVADAGLGHDGDGDGLLDLLDELGVGHAGDAALRADVGRDALEGHDGASAGLLGDAGLLGVDDVHDDAAAEHLGQAHLDGEGGLLGRGLGYRTVAVHCYDAASCHFGTRLPSALTVKTPYECDTGHSRFATHTGVSGKLLYHIPKYRLLFEPLGEKKPSSKLWPEDTKVWPSVRVSLKLMVSAAVQDFGTENEMIRKEERRIEGRASIVKNKEKCADDVDEKSDAQVEIGQVPSQHEH
ncbi:hypothetical protein RJ640_025794 [Escallonia rubra]|uniref:Uncharacterized protein n=1 Tax=Escallonia rubra TaxID=112253 RepID=A0AA88R655_9ASTE|nr:hypothetical protein RJ640_025794 [Escallonia rubra]